MKSRGKALNADTARMIARETAKQRQRELPFTVEGTMGNPNRFKHRFSAIRNADAIKTKRTEQR